MVGESACAALEACKQADRTPTSIAPVMHPGMWAGQSRVGAVDAEPLVDTERGYRRTIRMAIDTLGTFGLVTTSRNVDGDALSENPLRLAGAG